MPTQRVTTQQVLRYFDTEEKPTIVSAAAHFGVSPATISARLSRGDGGRPINLTKHDLAVFKAIVKYVTKNSWAPSITDLVEMTGASRSAVHNSIHRLAAVGVIELGDGARTIRVVGSKIDMEAVHEPA
jgi:multidrug efflux pump subunit AcrB